MKLVFEFWTAKLSESDQSETVFCNQSKCLIFLLRIFCSNIMHSESVPFAILFYPFPIFGPLLDPTLKSGCVVQRVCEHTVSGLNKASDSKQAGQAAPAVVDLFSSHARPTRPTRPVTENV